MSYLQNGDSPRSVLVSNLLMGDKYNSWRRSMEMSLKAMNKMRFINGAITRSTDGIGSPVYCVGKVQQNGFVMDSELKRYWENNCIC